MARTRVVHLKKEPFDVYIGRPCPDFPKGSVFANPFRIGPDGSRGAVIEKYRRHAQADPGIQAALPTLRGRTLGCWCKPEECHGDVLVEMLEGQSTLRSQADLF